MSQKIEFEILFEYITFVVGKVLFCCRFDGVLIVVTLGKMFSRVHYKFSAYTVGGFGYLPQPAGFHRPGVLLLLEYIFLF